MQNNSPGTYLSIAFLVILCLLLGEEHSQAQRDINPGMKMVMIYRFAQQIEWEDEEAIDTFHIGVFGKDPDLMREMLLLRSVPLKGKIVSVRQYNRVRDLDTTHILYITNDRNPELERILDKITWNNTLLISDRYSDQNRIMINFLPMVENKIQFEVNKANIINEGMTVLPDLLLLGGSEVDVAELYRESQDAMQRVVEQVARLYDSLKVQSAEIEARNIEIVKQKDLINQQTADIEAKEAEIRMRENELADLLKEVRASQQNLDAKNEQIKEQLDRISEQENEINNRNAVLDLIQKEIDSQQKKIEEQKSELNAYITLVEKQRFALYLFIAFCVLILGLIFFIYRGYKIKQNANRDLEKMYAEITARNREISKQKQEIENKNEELQKKHEEILTQADELHHANEEILSTNEALERQKNELQLTLENLKLTQEQLVQSEKLASVGQLTAGIAHELNNPVNFISGNVNPLKRDLEDVFKLLDLYETIINNRKLNESFLEAEDLKKNLELTVLTKEINNLLEGIAEGAHRSSEIVKGLRSFSRLDDEKFVLADIHDGIDSTLILLYNKTKNRINVHKEYGDLPSIECLPSKLNQVFMNVLTNSIQAIEDKGNIFIETISSGIGIKICIRDNGAGMSPEVKKHIFEPFYTTKDVGRGTGLGLSISYGIIEQHHGNIDVISEPDKGTEFIISLPIVQPDIM